MCRRRGMLVVVVVVVVVVVDLTLNHCDNPTRDLGEASSTGR